MRTIAIAVLLLLTSRREMPPPLMVKASPEIAIADSTNAGLPFITQLCDAVTAADKVGNWFCHKGDGTSATGSTITLSAVGTVTPETQRYCPNGPDCLPTLRQFRTAAAASTPCDTGCDHGYESSNVLTGLTDITICQEITIGSQGFYENYFHKGTTVSGIDLLFQKVPGSAAVGLYVGAGTLGNLTLTLGVRHLVCMTVVAGSGTAAKGFLDGVRVLNTTATLTNNTGGWRISGYAGGNFPVREQSAVGDTFVTRTVLSEARIAELAHMVLADQPTTTRGDLIETDRSTVRTCKSSDGQVNSIIPPNRACIANGRFQVRATRTAATINGMGFDNDTDWPKTETGATITVTGDYAVAPDGTKTADRVVSSATSGVQLGVKTQNFTVTSGGPAVCEVELQGNKSDTTDLCLYDGAAWTCAACAYTASRSFCYIAAASGTGTTRTCAFGNNSLRNGGVARTASDVNVWCLRGEGAATPSACIPTYTTSVQHVQEVDFKFPNAGLIANGIGSRGCMSADFVPKYSVTSLVAAFGWMANTGRALYINSTFRTYDGTQEPIVASGLVLDTRTRARARWFGSTLAVDNITTGGTSSAAFDGTMATTGYPSASYFTFCSASGALGAAVADYECGGIQWSSIPEVCQ